MSRHLPSDRLLEYLDGTLAGADKQEAEAHLAVCQSCKTALKDFQHMARTLHSVPLRKTSEDFSRSVMSRVLSGGKEPFTFRLLTGLAYGFAMLIVLVVLGGVFVLTGVIDADYSSQGENRIQSLFETTSSTLAAIPSAMTNLIREYLPFMFGTGSFGITVAIVFVVMMLFVFDRMMGWRLAGRVR